MASTKPYTVLVPIADARQAAGLIDFAAGLVAGPSQRGGGRLVLLGVVEIPPRRSLSEGALLARQERRLLREIARHALAETVEVKTRVRVAHQAWEGIQEAVAEEGADLLLLGWRGQSRRADRVFGTTIDALVKTPPCDVAVVKFDAALPSAALPQGLNILVPLRGGPHAELALRLASFLAERYDATVTLLHIERDDASWAQRQEDRRGFTRLLVTSGASGRIRQQFIAGPVVETILKTAQEHQLVVMGATARGEGSLFGDIPETVAARAQGAVMVVKTREPIDPARFHPQREPVPALVDRWFAENTFHAREFADLDELVELKRRQGLIISLGLPTRNQATTVGPVVRTLLRELVEQRPLLDEVALIDYGSTDATMAEAAAGGIPVYRTTDILPQYGGYSGKGDALWKSLFVLRGDIIAWLEPDIKNIHPKFVYGIVGPLLREERLQYVKGFYRRPIPLGEESPPHVGGGRVDELTARPLINLFFPELSGLVQPLGREHAGRRRVLEQVPFFSGFGVEMGLLLDLLSRFGLFALAQSDLEERLHRSQPLYLLGQRAFGLVQAVMRRLGEGKALSLGEDAEAAIKLIREGEGRFFLEEVTIAEVERPPMASIPEYQERKPRRPFFP